MPRTTRNMLSYKNNNDDTNNDNKHDNNNDNDENSQRIKQTSEVPRVPPSRAFAAHAPVECWMYPKNQWSGILDDAMMHQEFVVCGNMYLCIIYIYIYIHTYPYITLHCIALHCITLYHTTWHDIALHYIALHYIALHNYIIVIHVQFASVLHLILI